MSSQSDSIISGVFGLAIVGGLAYWGYGWATNISYLKIETCYSAGIEKACAISLAKIKTNVPQQLVIVRPEGEAPQSLKGCSVFDSGSWSCDDAIFTTDGRWGYLQPADSMLTSKTFTQQWAPLHLIDWATSKYPKYSTGKNDQMYAASQEEFAATAFRIASGDAQQLEFAQAKAIP